MLTNTEVNCSYIKKYTLQTMWGSKKKIKTNINCNNITGKKLIIIFTAQLT